MIQNRRSNKAVAEFFAKLGRHKDAPLRVDIVLEPAVQHTEALLPFPAIRR